MPGTFLDPDRMNAGLMWFTRGFVEYVYTTAVKWLAGADELRKITPLRQLSLVRVTRAGERGREALATLGSECS